MNEFQENDGRWYPKQPRVGIGAVVLKEGRLLMVKRGHEPSKGKWSIPGGMIELGETLHEAARREVMEECSIKVEVEHVIDGVNTIIRDADDRVQYHFVIVDLLARYISGEPRAQSDAEACRWVSPRELVGLDIPPSLRDMLKRQGILKEV